jgi:hypothetical protein
MTVLRPSPFLSKMMLIKTHKKIFLILSFSVEALLEADPTHVHIFCRTAAYGRPGPTYIDLPGIVLKYA